VATAQPAMLLLLPDPKINEYRFEAELRIDSHPKGTAGLFVGQTMHDAEEGQLYGQAVARIVFPEDGHREVLPQFLLTHFSPDSGSAAQAVQLGRQDPVPIPEAGWHHLAIAVGRLETLRAAIDQVPIADVSRDSRLQTADDMVRQRLLRGKRSVAHPVFPPHGGLGLYVSGATASFRRVVITPAPLDAGGGIAFRKAP
jgi:hypothetical protein